MVYIDEAEDKVHGLEMCHMFADTIAELRKMASMIGLKREWMIVSKAGIPFFEVSKSNRYLAIRGGAQAVNREQLLKIMASCEKGVRSMNPGGR